MQDFDKGCFNAYQRINGGEKDNLNGYELSEVCIEESVKESIGEALRDATKTMTFITESKLFSLSEEEYIKYHNIGAVFQPVRKDPKQTRQFFYSEEGMRDACIFHQGSTSTTLLTPPKN